MMIQEAVKQCYSQKDYQQNNSFCHSFEQLTDNMCVADTCPTCGNKASIIINDFADLVPEDFCKIHLKMLPGCNRPINMGVTSLPNGISVMVFKTNIRQRSILKFMGSHIIVECRKCKKRFAYKASS